LSVGTECALVKPALAKAHSSPSCCYNINHAVWVRYHSIIASVWQSSPQEAVTDHKHAADAGRGLLKLNRLLGEGQPN
jgi:hypothetical protein